MMPLALWPLLHRHMRHAELLVPAAIALLALAAFFSLVLLCIARHPRWALRANAAGLHLPRSRFPLVAAELERVPWAELRIIRLNDGFDLIVESRTRKWIVPAYWLRTRGTAQSAQAALDDRLRREQQKIGASKAR